MVDADAFAEATAQVDGLQDRPFTGTSFAKAVRSCRSIPTSW
jgi:hypothetical protein